MGRATQGVRLINLEKRNDEIASVCVVDKEEQIVENAENAISEETPTTESVVTDETPEQTNE
jgi:DNA gyrase subunit A